MPYSVPARRWTPPAPRTGIRLIVVSGTYPAGAGRPVSGRLVLVTVSVRDRLSIADAVAGWLRDDATMVPRELVYPAQRTV